MRKPLSRNHLLRHYGLPDAPAPTPIPGSLRHPHLVKKEIVWPVLLRQAAGSLDPGSLDGRGVSYGKERFGRASSTMFRMSKIILAVLCTTVGAQAGLSKLDALGMIESGNNDAAVGTYGEVSRFQIRPHIWREYTESRAWRDVRVSTSVAHEFLGDLEDTFRKRARREPTDFDLYVLWNAGPSYYAKISFSAARVHPVIRERAERYVNLRRMKNAVRPAVATAAAPATAPTTSAPAKASPSPAPSAVQPAPSLAQTLSAPLPKVHFPALRPIVAHARSPMLAAAGSESR